MDTIYALSSGALPSGVAIVRVSGSKCRSVVQALCRSVPAPRSATVCTLRDGIGAPIDTGILLYFEGPRSFTGEDCVEFHVHGGRAVVAALLSFLSEMDGVRHAEAGEFSRRAFMNGKMDLVEAEGLADLITADTEMQRRLAQDYASGGQSKLYDDWARRLLHARAMIEAELDFADEDDVPGSVSSAIWVDIKRLSDEITQHVARAPVGEIIRDGLKVVIAGPPNSGKSSLMNFLAKRDVAIVSNVAGTTRDVLTIDINLDGYAIKIYDTAGLREASDEIESEGIRRARLHLADADLVLFICDGTRDTDDLGIEIIDTEKTIRIRSKMDLPDFRGEESSLSVSTVTGIGVDRLLDSIRAYLRDRVSYLPNSIPSRRRHVELLVRCNDSLTKCLMEPDDALEIRGEYLRLALDELGRITGKIGVEDVLGVIFAEFCIGK